MLIYIFFIKLKFLFSLNIILNIYLDKMTGIKKIKQFKFFYLCAKLRAFTDVMLDGDEKEWKIFLSRHEEFLPQTFVFNGIDAQ
jgi:hypothetical protein